MTPEQYNAARDAVDWEGDVAPGGLFHVAWFEGGALRVVDAWESAELFQAFVETRLTPGVQKVGIAGEPEVAILPAHRAFAPAPVKQ